MKYEYIQLNLCNWIWVFWYEKNDWKNGINTKNMNELWNKNVEKCLSERCVA